MVGDNGIEAQVAWNTDGSPSISLVSADGRLRFASTASAPGMSTLVRSPMVEAGHRLGFHTQAVLPRAVSDETCQTIATVIGQICKTNKSLAVALPVACSAAAGAVPPFAVQIFAFCDAAASALLISCEVVNTLGTSVVSGPCILFFHQDPSWTVTGQVVDEATDKPIPGALIDMTGMGMHTSVQTGADGRYSISPFPRERGDYQITATATAGVYGLGIGSIGLPQTGATLDFALGLPSDVAGRWLVIETYPAPQGPCEVVQVRELWELQQALGGILSGTTTGLSYVGKQNCARLTGVGTLTGSVNGSKITVGLTDPSTGFSYTRNGILAGKTISGTRELTAGTHTTWIATKQ